MKKQESNQDVENVNFVLFGWKETLFISSSLVSNPKMENLAQKMVSVVRLA